MITILPEQFYAHQRHSKRTNKNYHGHSTIKGNILCNHPLVYCLTVIILKLLQLIKLICGLHFYNILSTYQIEEANDMPFPIRNLSKGQRRLCVEIVDYSWLGLELPMNRENWELAIIDYSNIFLYWKMQLQTTTAIIGIYKCTLHGHENHSNSNCFDVSRLLADYHCHFHAYQRFCPFMQLTIVWILKTNPHIHARTRMRAGDNLQYNILTEWNILKCAHDFLKCILCLAYPTILALKSNTFFGTHGHKEQFYFTKGCSD